MKTVLLVRHAKSSWDDPLLADFDRPLAARGRGAAPRIARYMRDKSLIPDLVVCSAARRAQETWELMAPVLGVDIPVDARPDLHHTSPGRMLEALRGAPDDASSVLLIGHSPGMEALAIGLCGPGSSQSAFERLCAKVPTAALAVIRFEAERWSDIGEGQGALKRFVRLRDLD